MYFQFNYISSSSSLPNKLVMLINFRTSSAGMFWNANGENEKNT